MRKILIVVVLCLITSAAWAHGPNGNCMNCAFNRGACAQIALLVGMGTAARKSLPRPATWPLEPDTLYPAIWGQVLYFQDGNGAIVRRIPIVDGRWRLDGRMERLGDGRIALSAYDDKTGHFLGVRIYDGHDSRSSNAVGGLIYLPYRSATTWTIKDLSLGWSQADGKDIKRGPGAIK